MASLAAKKDGGDINGGPSEEEDQLQQLLGTSCCVNLSDSTVKRGFLLEVRYLWLPRLLSGNGTTGVAPQLYGFVRIKDADHRISGWFPIDCIDLKETGGANGATSCGSSYPTNSAAYNSMVVAKSRITHPIISPVYREVTPGMVRTRREGKQLDFFEERLLRDCRTPTTVRYFIYLCKFAFPPWYYAPYGMLNREYDPLAPLSDAEREALRFTQGSTNESIDTNPFIRDAYLCPFSLRIYSTFEQMQHETLRYRAGHLHPPGLEIYRDDTRGFSMFEVNGSRHVTYCRHLFLLGKSFLENKLAGHDVHNYYFYVVCLHHRHYPHYTDDTSAMYFVGYFTWEKQVTDNNLACIVTLPYFMGGGASSGQQKDLSDDRGPVGADTASREGDTPKLGHFGQFMIAASYELAYRRKNVGSPEKPLTDLGAAAYDRYWKRVLIKWMHTLLEGNAAAITVDDDAGDDGQSVTIVVAHENEAKMAAPGALKRPRPGTTDGSGCAEEVQGARVAEGDTLVDTTVRSIAKQVRLEEADVLRTLLQMGVLHLNAEDRSMRVVIPVSFVNREYGKMKKWAHDMTRAEFDPKLLTGRGGPAWLVNTPSPRRHNQHQS
ncbi:histone acetyltransferase, putative [Trypanosoma brucei gambiense DAL972]|uniref:Histone acetyltransferase, putative n=1 Tax=Trypanosoma brucei gambiense (strain MHOM/CI/86/DAL972) TaxID=679716 RepID=D0A925_TRYB9|nr:histone acetyltransferase, putative [Trypanosoma brucei gambiense DAL972]CBH18176.1 histone acetyltransferase, putative [Trypanosoma brucei gambiense DAL972]|eukprot:XP_011780440.1 histone acetyltransferase, putative [Trypanosoma brucei gambiense DAL972]